MQCVRNLLSSFTRHRHILHAGYTFAGTGSWILQDGTFSYADLSELFHEPDVQRVLRAYENSVSVDVHCCAEGPWRDASASAQPFSRYCKVRVNPPDVLTAGSSAITSFIDYVSEFVEPAALESLLEPSDVVGNIRFSHPTLYVFPGGQGDAALFGINGFNMLVDGGFGRKSCFWDFARHLDRLDAVLLTRLNNANAHGLASLLRRKRNAHVYPQIGHFFCNLQDRKVVTSPDGDKDRDNLLVSLVEEGQEMVLNLRELHLKPSPCYRDSVVEPVNLYHKVGHGKLDMYVVSPARDSREVKEFLARWAANDAKLFASHLKKDARDFQFPLQNMVSICALLVWQPANPQDTITRILFPGSTPQVKIFEGLDKIRHLEYLKHPRCTAKSLSPSPSIVSLSAKTQARKYTPTVLDKITPGEQQKTYTRTVPTSETNKHHVLKAATIPIAGGVPDTKVYRTTTTSTLNTKSQLITKKVEKSKTESEKQEKDSVSSEKKLEDLQNNKEEKMKESLRARSKPRQSSHSKERKVLKAQTNEKKDAGKKEKKEERTSPTTPKRILDGKVNGASTRSESTTRVSNRSSSKTRRSPSGTPAKSAKEANNRKVAESKVQTSRAVSLSRTGTSKTSKREEIVESTGKVKQVDKPISKRTKPASPSKTIKLLGSPAKAQPKATGVKTTLRKSRANDKDAGVKKGEPQYGDKEKIISVVSDKGDGVADNAQEEKTFANEDVKNVIVEIVDTNVTEEGKQGLPVDESASVPPQSAASEEDEKKSEGEIRSIEGEEEEEDEYLVIEKEEPYTEESFQDQLSAESHAPVAMDDRGVSDDDGEDEKLKRDTQESEKIKEVEKPRKKSEPKLTMQLTDKEHAEQIAKSSTEQVQAAERKLSLKPASVLSEALISPGDKEKLFEEVQGIITSATELVSKKEEKASPVEDGLKNADESKSEEKLNDRVEDDVKVTDGKQFSSEQKEESQPDEKMSTTVESGATTAPTLPEDERIPLDDIKEVVEEKHILEETKEKECEQPQADEPLPEMGQSARPGHFNIQGAVCTLHRDIIKTPDEVADLPVDEEYDPSMYSKEEILKSPCEDAPRKHSTSGIGETGAAKVADDKVVPVDIVKQEIDELEHIKEMREMLEDAAGNAPFATADKQTSLPEVVGTGNDQVKSNHENYQGKENRDEQEKDVDTKEVCEKSASESPSEVKKVSTSELKVEERSDICVSLEELRILGHEVADLKPPETKRVDAKYSDIEPRNLVEPDVPIKEIGGKPVTISILHVGESLASEISAVEKDSSGIAVMGIPEPLEAVQEDVYLESSVEEEPIYGKTDALTHPEYVTVTPDSSPEGPKSPSEKRHSVSTKGSRKSSSAGKETDIKPVSDTENEREVIRRESIPESTVIEPSSHSKVDSRRSSGIDQSKCAADDEGNAVLLPTTNVEEKSSVADKEGAQLGVGDREVSSMVQDTDELVSSKPTSRKPSTAMKDESVHTPNNQSHGDERFEAQKESSFKTNVDNFHGEIKKSEDLDIDPSASVEHVTTFAEPECLEGGKTETEKNSETVTDDSTVLEKVKSMSEKPNETKSAEKLNEYSSVLQSPDTDLGKTLTSAAPTVSKGDKVEDIVKELKEETPEERNEGKSIAENDCRSTTKSQDVPCAKGITPTSLGPPDTKSGTTPDSPLTPASSQTGKDDIEICLSSQPTKKDISDSQATPQVDSSISTPVAPGNVPDPVLDASETLPQKTICDVTTKLQEGSTSLQADASTIKSTIEAECTQSATTSPTKSATPSADVTSRPSSAASNKSSTMETDISSVVVGSAQSLSSSPTKSGTPSADATSRPTSSASNKSATIETDVSPAVVDSAQKLTTSPTKSGTPSVDVTSRPNSAASNRSTTMEVDLSSAVADSAHSLTTSPTKSATPGADVTSRPTSSASNKSSTMDVDVRSAVADSAHSLTTSPTKSATPSADATSRPTSSASNKSATMETDISPAVADSAPSPTTSPTKNATPSADITSRPTSAASNKSTTMETDISPAVADSTQSLSTSPTKIATPSADVTSRPASAASDKSVTVETEVSANVVDATQSLAASPTKSATSSFGVTSRPDSAASHKSATVDTEVASAAADGIQSLTTSPTKGTTPCSEVTSRPTSAASNKSITLETDIPSAVVGTAHSLTTSPTNSPSLHADVTSRPTSAASNKSATIETEISSAVGDSGCSVTTSPTKIATPNADVTSRPASVASNTSATIETDISPAVIDSAHSLTTSPTKSATLSGEPTSRPTSAGSTKSAMSESEPLPALAGGTQSLTISPTKHVTPSAEVISRHASPATEICVTELQVTTDQAKAETRADSISSSQMSEPVDGSLATSNISHESVALVPNKTDLSVSTEKTFECSTETTSSPSAQSPSTLSKTSQHFTPERVLSPVTSLEGKGEVTCAGSPPLVQETKTTNVSPPASPPSKTVSPLSPDLKMSPENAPSLAALSGHQSPPSGPSGEEGKSGVVINRDLMVSEHTVEPDAPSSSLPESLTTKSDAPLQTVGSVSVSPEPSLNISHELEYGKTRNDENVTKSAEVSRKSSVVGGQDVSLILQDTEDLLAIENVLHRNVIEKETAESSKLKKEAEDTEKAVVHSSIDRCETDNMDDLIEGTEFSIELGNARQADLMVDTSVSSLEEERRSGATTPSILVTGCKTLARQSQPSESDSEMPEEDSHKRQDDNVFESSSPITNSPAKPKIVATSKESEAKHSGEEETSVAQTVDQKVAGDTQTSSIDKGILTSTQEFLITETERHTDTNIVCSGAVLVSNSSENVPKQPKSADSHGISDAVGISSTVFTEIAAVEKAEAATSPMTPLEPGNKTETGADSFVKEATKSFISSEKSVSGGAKELCVMSTDSSRTESTESKTSIEPEAKSSFIGVTSATSNVSIVQQDSIKKVSSDEHAALTISRDGGSDLGHQETEEERKTEFEHESEEPEFTLVSKSVHEEYINVPANENDGDCKKLAATTTVSTFTAKDVSDSPKHGDITKTVTTVTKVTKSGDGADSVETTTTEEVQSEGKITSVTTKTESSPLHKRSATEPEDSLTVTSAFDSSSSVNRSLIDEGSDTSGAKTEAGLLLQSAVVNVVDGVASVAKQATDGFEDAMAAGLSLLTSVVGVRKDSLEATRSCTPGSDVEIEPSTPRSDVSSGQVSRAPTDYRLESEDEDGVGSPTSLTSQLTHSPPPPHFDFDIGDPHRTIAGGLAGIRDDQYMLESRTSTSQVRRQTIADPMTTSMYSVFSNEPLAESSERQTDQKLDQSSYMQLSEVIEEASKSTSEYQSGDIMSTSVVSSLTSDRASFDQAVEEHRAARGSDLTRSTENIHTLHEEKPDASSANVFKSVVLSEGPGTSLQAPVEGMPPGSGKEPQGARVSDLASLPTIPKDPIEDWGKPLGLPSPAPPPSNTTEESAPSPKGTPQKDKLGSRKAVSDNKRRPESPRKSHRISKGNPIYIDLTYVPHHGNSYYASLEFFKRVRARYYVFSGIEPSRDVYNALLEAKQSWEDKDLEVTIIPTYDTDTLGYWVAENEDALAKYKIDLSPSASRCTINLQDHETSCSAYRLEF
ncbi:hypothetical protein FOCC_FOCC003957 [Frankliniella occidentalis]|nr:hypothetical protein FOCC_FOCC003957 [Frankliniella occidentalis]